MALLPATKEDVELYADCHLCRKPLCPGQLIHTWVTRDGMSWLQQEVAAHAICTTRLIIEEMGQGAASR